MGKLLYLLLLLSAAAAQTIDGTVIDGLSGAGVAGARVAIQSPSGKTVAQSVSDAQGRYRIEGVQDGTYTVRCFSPAYLPDTFGPRRELQVLGGRATLELRLMPRARLTGRVTDPAGSGLVEARLMLTAPGFSLAMTTDEKGGFELRDLVDPGEYVLSVSPPPGKKPPAPDPETGRPRAWARTWYPGVTTSEAAARITVRPGMDIPHLDWRLLAVPARTVRGKLLLPDGAPAPDVDIDIGDDPRRPLIESESNSDGSFEFQIPDGRWRITAEAGKPDERLRAAQPLEVLGRDIDGLTLRLAASFLLRGKVIVETRDGAPNANPAAVSVCPREGDCLRLPVDAAGNFLFDHLFPGVYRVQAADPPPGAYLAALRLGAVDALGLETEITSGLAPLIAVYRTDGGTLRGSVARCALGGVLLVPADPSLRRSGFARTAPCDGSPAEDQRYELRDVRPGDYYAVAFAGDGEIPWRLAAYRVEVGDTFFREGTLVSIRAADSAALDLRASPPR